MLLIFVDALDDLVFFEFDISRCLELQQPVFNLIIANTIREYTDLSSEPTLPQCQSSLKGCITRAENHEISLVIYIMCRHLLWRAPDK
jgi:hypothetical protein